MSTPVELQSDFSVGASQDQPRHQLPKGKVYSLTDFIPELDGAPLAKRGGWVRTWNAMSNTAATYAAGVAFAPFSSGASKVVGIDDQGKYHVTSFGAAPSVTVGSATRVPAQVPTFWKDYLFFLDVNGSAAPQKWDGTSLTSVGGSPANAALSCVYKNHLIFARSSTAVRRVWFSNANDSETWDLTDPGGQWLDMDMPVEGIVSMKNMILVFGEGYTQRIRGDIIPGVVGSDMVVEPMFAIGCSDPASVAVTDDYVVFANSSGIYLTDGVGVADLTEQSGMSQFWKTTMAGYTSTYTIAACVYRGWYVFSVMNGSSLVVCGMLDVKRRRYVKLTNLKATMMLSTPVGILDTPPKLIFAERGALRVSEGTQMWTPSATYKNDGDGTAVTPVVELPHYYGKPGKKRWKHLYVKYHMTDGATDNPTLTAAYTTDLESSSYTSITPTLTETSAATRARVPIRVAAEGVSLKLTQANASGITHIYGLEADMDTMEPGRL